MTPDMDFPATATIVAGADAAGSEAAASYLARRVPYVWENARGSVTLAEVALPTVAPDQG